MSSALPLGDPITVVVAEELALFRSALLLALADEGDITVVGDAGDAKATVALVERRSPAVAALSSTIPGVFAPELCARLKERSPATALVVLGAADDAQLLQAVLWAGAEGYVAKSSSLGEVVRAVRRVAGGEAALPIALLRQMLVDLVEERRYEDDALRRLQRLTPREREVLALLVEGLSQSSMASRLMVSPHTIRTHIQNLLEALSVHSRLEAVALATKCNFIERFGRSGLSSVER